MGGVFGVSTQQENAQSLTYYALYAIQHRGQFGCGIASDHNGYIDYEKGHGLVTNVLKDDVLRLLRGKIAIGFVSNSQTYIPALEMNPKVIGYGKGVMGVVFDGHLLNYDELKGIVDDCGVNYEHISHPEIVANLIAIHYNGDIIEAIKKTLQLVKGAYSFLLMTDNRLILARDRYGIKPLVLGKLEDGYMVSSETCSFDAVGGSYLRDIEPGEMVIIEGNRLYEEQLFKPLCNRSCIFEAIYYARPDSILNGKSIYRMRINSGKQLAKRNDISADVVIGAPDSGMVAAIGFAEEAKIPYGIGIIKNRYVGRTFIERDQNDRIDKVRIKLNVLRENVEGRDIIVVDDSIVRGTTMTRTVKMLRDAGAKTVHVRIASPKVYHVCELGVNQSVSGKMIAATHSTEEIRKLIGADSLMFMSIEDTLESFGLNNSFCTGCLDKQYPIELEATDED